MKDRLLKYVVCIILLLSSICGRAQNNPYVDDKLLHIGFSLGMDVLSYSIQQADTALQIDKHGDAYYPRTSAPSLGLAVGFITDLRMTRHLNLRFCPALHFGSRTINYKSYTDTVLGNHPYHPSKQSLLSIPVSIPLYVKWSAEREFNYRPYVIAGGGISIDIMRDKEKVILPKRMDYFMEVGFGCDFYFRWFKLSPEIRYRVGFNNVLTPTADCQKEGWGIGKEYYYYTDAIEKLTNQQLSLIFNFE